MANSKFFIASILIFALAIHFGQALPGVPAQSPIAETNCTAYVPPASGKIDCGAACVARCCKSSRLNLCQRACGSCCDKCNCVPPGTYGNYEACPCYAALTTHGNKRKCP